MSGGNVEDRLSAGLERTQGVIYRQNSPRSLLRVITLDNLAKKKKYLQRLMRGYFIRLTPDDEISLDDIVRLIEGALLPESYVISREEASRIHFHILVYTDFSPERLRYRIKALLATQVYISGKDIVDKVRTIAYTIKDGNYRTKGIDPFEWLEAKRISHKKEKFEDALKVIEGNYGRTGNADALVRELITLHLDFNKKIYKQHLKAHFETIKIKKDLDFRERFIKDILGIW